MQYQLFPILYYLKYTSIRLDSASLTQTTNVVMIKKFCDNNLKLTYLKFMRLSYNIFGAQWLF